MKTTGGKFLCWRRDYQSRVAWAAQPATRGTGSPASKKPTFRFRAAAFTLLELLVAVTITLLMAGLMLAITTNVLGLWRRQQAASTQAITARQVLDQLERDLQTAIHRRDASRWLAADILDGVPALSNHGWLAGSGLMKPANGGSLLPLPPTDAQGLRRIEDARFGLSGVWLRLVGFIPETVENSEWRITVPSVIAYQVARRPVVGHPVASNPASVRYSLYRVEVRAEDVLDPEGGYDVTAPRYASTNNSPYDVDSSRSWFSRNVMNPGHANLIASNVVDFGCWLYARDAAGNLVRIYPAAESDLSHHAVGQSTANDLRFPSVADVMVRILSEEGASLVEAMEAGRVRRPPDYASDATWWWSVVEANSAVFTRRIEIKGGVL